MDDQLDDNLKNRIKEVFDNFEDTSADEGWLELRKKFPEGESNRRAFAWIWWGATAALMLLFLGIGIWMYTKKQAPVQFAQHIIKQQVNKNAIPGPVTKDTINQISSIKPAQAVTTLSPHLTNKDADNLKRMSSKVISGDKTIAANNTILNDSSTKVSLSTTKATPKVNTPNNKASNQQIVAKQNVPKVVIIPSIIVNSGTNNQQQAAMVDINKTADEQAVNKTKPIVPVTGNTASNAVADTTAPATVIVNNQQHTKNINDMFAEDQDKTQKKDGATNKEDKKVHFGVYAATYFNYAKGSSNQINAGAGFTSDIAINKNLKLVTGVSVNQNTLNYAGTTPTTASQNDLALVASTAVYNFTTANHSAAGSYGATNLNPSLNYSSSFISLKNYNANLVGLDIPINLKYEFNQLKHNLYVVAGFSSGTFINEAYTYQYNYPSVTSTAVQQEQNETTTKNFNSFYFAKTLNLGFGLGYALGKNSMVIEPFLKYPLQGLGAQQIRFGAGGINLKFNFSSKK